MNQGFPNLLIFPPQGILPSPASPVDSSAKFLALKKVLMVKIAPITFPPPNKKFFPAKFLISPYLLTLVKNPCKALIVFVENEFFIC